MSHMRLLERELPLINLRESLYEELATFSEMERQSHARKFVNVIPLATHQKNFTDESVIYLSIEKTDGKLVGYFILGVEEELDSVEFRRIVIDENQRGIGQIAILQMEKYCKMTLDATRIWLDVYGDNERGKHIYEKLGYKRFKTDKYGERQLHYYDKSL